MLARNDLALYLADHYGRCKLGAGCRCLRDGWRGCLCPQWIPTEARDWDEMRAEMIKFRNA